MEIAREIGDRRGEANALGNIGSSYVALGKSTSAIDFLQQSQTIRREIGDLRGGNSALNDLGAAFFQLGDTSSSIGYFQEYLTKARQIGDRRGEGNVLNNLGLAYAEIGDIYRATEYCQQGLTIARELRDRRAESKSLSHLAQIHDKIDDKKSASELYKQALAITAEMDDHYEDANARWNYGIFLAHLGDLVHALPLLERGVSFYNALAHPRAAKMAQILEHIKIHGVVPGEKPTLSKTSLQLPDTVRAAIAARDIAKLRAALLELPIMEAQAIVTELRKAGIIDSVEEDPNTILAAFASLVNAVSSVIQGDAKPLVLVKQELSRLEKAGWRLRKPVERILAGERKERALLQGLNIQESLVVKHLLSELSSKKSIRITRYLQPEQIAATAKVAVDNVRSIGETKHCIAFAAELEERARWAAITVRVRGFDWQQLSEYLRTLATQLKTE